jgi:hypothetical protein
MRVLVEVAELNLRLRKARDLLRRANVKRIRSRFYELVLTLPAIGSVRTETCIELSLHMFDKRQSFVIAFLTRIDCAARLSQQAETFFAAALA